MSFGGRRDRFKVHYHIVRYGTLQNSHRGSAQSVRRVNGRALGSERSLPICPTRCATRRERFLAEAAEVCFVFVHISSL